MHMPGGHFGNSCLQLKPSWPPTSSQLKHQYSGQADQVQLKSLMKVPKSTDLTIDTETLQKVQCPYKFKLPGSFKVRVMDAQQSFRIPQSGQSCNFSYGVHSLEIFMAKKEPSQKASHQENDKSCITPEKERLLHRSYPHQLPSVMKHSKTCKA
jgi:hypothetical protein